MNVNVVDPMEARRRYSERFSWPCPLSTWFGPEGVDLLEDDGNYGSGTDGLVAGEEHEYRYGDERLLC